MLLAAGVLSGYSHRTRSPRRLAFRCSPEDMVDSRLVATAGCSQPSQYVCIQPDGELYFGRRPGNRRLLQKLSAERGNF
jgi:hypothetical protein